MVDGIIDRLHCLHIAPDLHLGMFPEFFPAPVMSFQQSIIPFRPALLQQMQCFFPRIYNIFSRKYCNPFIRGISLSRHGDKENPVEDLMVFHNLFHLRRIGSLHSLCHSNRNAFFMGLCRYDHIILLFLHGDFLQMRSVQIPHLCIDSRDQFDICMKIRTDLKPHPDHMYLIHTGKPFCPQRNISSGGVPGRMSVKNSMTIIQADSV